MRVKNFGWSTLGDVIKDAIPDMEAYVDTAKIGRMEQYIQ